MEELVTKIQDAYADCTTCKEVAVVYANIMMENQNQMELMMDCLSDAEAE